MSQPAAKLRPEVARKYQLGTHHTRLIHPKHGDIDLLQLTLERADELVATGKFPYLVRKPKASKKKKV